MVEGKNQCFQCSTVVLSNYDRTHRTPIIAFVVFTYDNLKNWVFFKNPQYKLYLVIENSFKK